jgi:transposase
VVCTLSNQDSFGEKTSSKLEGTNGNIVTYCTHGIMNALAEGINSEIKSIKRRAGGIAASKNLKKP